jgi:hypothetical protein
MQWAASYAVGSHPESESGDPMLALSPLLSHRLRLSAYTFSTVDAALPYPGVWREFVGIFDERPTRRCRGPSATRFSACASRLPGSEPVALAAVASINLLCTDGVPSVTLQRLRACRRPFQQANNSVLHDLVYRIADPPRGQAN